VTASWIAASQKPWGLGLDGAYHIIARRIPIARAVPGVGFAGLAFAEINEHRAPFFFSAHTIHPSSRAFSFAACRARATSA
jgi:hypothetical protein